MLNAERLHAIALALGEDLSETNAPELLSQLAEALREQAANPGDGEYEQQVSSLRQQVDEALARAPSNDFSPAWKQAVEELGVADLLGENLRKTVRDVFERNEITPSAAADELTTLADRLRSHGVALDQLLTGIDWLGIGAEELAFGEFEVGVLIPRSEVSNKLGPLGYELLELRRILLPFVELGTGSRPDFEVRSLSSSDFQVFLDSPGATALCIATAVERVIALYERLLNIRIARKQLKDAGVPDESVEGVEDYAARHMEAGTADVAEELLVEFGSQVDEGRANELRIELRLSLNALANRIDRGYHVEVRVGLPEPEDEESDEERPAPSPEAQRYYESIAAKQDTLKFIKLPGSPILSLEERVGESESESEH